LAGQQQQWTRKGVSTPSKGKGLKERSSLGVHTVMQKGKEQSKLEGPGTARTQSPIKTTSGAVCPLQSNNLAAALTTAMSRVRSTSKRRSGRARDHEEVA